MKFTSDFGRNFVIINNVKIPVPGGTKYVTIHMSGVLYGWTKRPYLSEGYWNCDENSGFRLGYVDWEESDTGFYEIYEVQS